MNIGENIANQSKGNRSVVKYLTMRNGVAFPIARLLRGKTPRLMLRLKLTFIYFPKCRACCSVLFRIKPGSVRLGTPSAIRRIPRAREQMTAEFRAEDRDSRGDFARAERGGGGGGGAA